MQAGDAGGGEWQVSVCCVLYNVYTVRQVDTPASAGLGQSGYSQQSQRWLGAVGGDMSGYTGLSTGL